MLAIEQLAAGVAHEINSSVAWIQSNLGSLERYMNDRLELMQVYEHTEKLLPPNSLAARAVRAAKSKANLRFPKVDFPALFRVSIASGA
ncbi:hypothetical protein [Aromatoleum bremense]|uniref:Signal transduction histidine kinase dimerisation/phosphoacceptor domain-containing protein n=1 Tax=Aromatoleum bremense TaxID=76115 RepID=A0ABX1NYP3_9RHOO|nr:hypothetical protein [Aromatoleum bremense]NMG17175.1 hypothetical protein [Aromatoleum bremense]QTQ30009.1 Uncharacterized protein pbN1_00170 [Aromatoleum bremense]